MMGRFFIGGGGPGKYLIYIIAGPHGSIGILLILA